MKYTIKQWLRKKTIYVKGMVCTSCEELIEKRIKQMTGILKVKGVYPDSKIEVTYDPKALNGRRIKRAIDRLGYEVVDKPRVKKTKTKEESFGLGKLIMIGILIYIFYPIIQNIPGFNFIPEVNPNMGFGILFVVGLLTSLHCIAMCGGINLSQCVTDRLDNNGQTISKFKPSFLYNAGRVISYTVIGGIVGAIGSVIDFPGSAKGIVAIFAGIMMMVMGLNMLNIFPGLRKFNPRLPKVFHKLHNGRTTKGPFYVGLLNGFMPCGPLQAMQIYALGTGSALSGALSMFFFSIGTVPLMFGLGAISSLLSSKFTKKVLKTSAVLVIVLGVVMLSRGLSLSGISVSSVLPVSTVNQQATQGEKAIIQGDIQVVTTTLQSGRYTPIVVQQGIPVRWTIEAEHKDINGCNNALRIPEYNLKKKLSPGDNVIEFMPDKAGNIPYSCWMGMIRSNITVVSQ